VLRRAGADVIDLAGPPGLPVAAAAVASPLDAGRFDLVAVVHAESATGILNPLEEIVAHARAHGALTVVDAVASVGGHALDVDALGVNVAVLGPQKALGGQAGGFGAVGLAGDMGARRRRSSRSATSAPSGSMPAAAPCRARPRRLSSTPSPRRSPGSRPKAPSRSAPATPAPPRPLAAERGC
jgi:cysteine sulfinate desulfinase/cysteine desulfurase-like protein